MRRECERVEREAWLLESGELSPGRAAEVRDHLETCARCGALHRAARMALDRYDASASEEVEDAAFARMVRRARREALDVDAFERPSARTGRAPLAGWRAALIGAAAAVALVLLGIAVGRSTAPGDDVAPLRAEVQALRSTLALSSLDRSSASARLRGIAMASEIEAPRPDLVAALVRTLLADPSPNVRLAAVDALFGLSETAPVDHRLIEILEAEPSPAVRIAIIDLLVSRRVERSIDALRRLEREAEDPVVRRHASWAVEALT